MKRWFSFALVLAMCFTTVLGDVSTAFAEDEPIAAEAVDQAVSQIDEAEVEIGAMLEEAELPGVPDADAMLDLPDGLEPEAPSDDAVSNGDADGEADDIVVGAPEESPEAFEPWYARARASLTLEVDAAVSCTIPEGSILLVTEKVGEGLLRVACENLSGVVDVSALEALTDEEVRAFMAQVAAQEAVQLYQELTDYPLPPQPNEQGAEQAEKAEEPQGEQTPADEADGAAEQSADTESAENTEKAEKDGDAAQSEGPEKADDAKPAQDDTADGENQPSEPNEGSADAEPSETAENAENPENAEGAENPDAPQSGENAENTETPAEDNPTPAEDPVYESVGAPSSIAVSPSSVTLGLKETYTCLTAIVVDANGAAIEGKAISWASSNAKVVRVDASGNLTAVKRGRANIVASVEGLPDAVVTVVVKNAPSKLTLTPKKRNISIGMGLQLVAKLNKGAAAGKLTFTSSNPGVAQVDDNGLVTGVGLGTATIVARTYNKKRASCKISVFTEPASIAIEKATYALAQGMSEKLVISVKDAGGIKTYANLKYVSSDPNCVAVDGNGKISGVNIGTATVTVTAHNGLTASCTVDVCGPPADMTLSAESITIGVKEKYRRMSYTLIPPQGEENCAAVVTWRSANKKIAKVNSKTGVITGVKAGTTTVIATTNNKISRRVKVVVKKAPKSLSLSPGELALTSGMTGQLVASYNAKNVNDNITYTSSDTNVATVDENGVVSAVARGSAVITGRTYNKKRATCTVNVYDLPSQVMMTESMTLAVGMSGQLECSTLDANGQPSIANYSFNAISGSGSVEVDASGRVTALSKGTARVRVSTHNGITSHLDGSGNRVETECVVTIVEAPSEIRIVSAKELVVGDSYTFSPKMYTPDGRETTIGSYEYSVSGDAVKLGEGGTITGVGAGQATVTVTTYNGVSASCLVTVTRRYRMFAAYSYYNVVEKGSLSFPKNNATSFQEVLSTSSIGGIRYENVGIKENPSKKSLLSSLSSAFSDSRDSDVSVVYLCSHGYNYIDVPKSSRSTHYGLQLPGYSNYKSSSEYYITSEEIFEAVSAIRGQVVLVLDSCYSGQFITNMRSKLKAAGGRISVMTAATNTKACYYNISDTSRACDFFTLYLLMGAGYDMRSHVNSGACPADTNGDGKLTFNEMFSYAKKSVKANVPGFKNKSWFHGDPKQTPYVYAGNNGDLVLFQYA